MEGSAWCAVVGLRILLFGTSDLGNMNPLLSDTFVGVGLLISSEVVPFALISSVKFMEVVTVAF